jgi:hypothetical protein
MTGGLEKAGQQDRMALLAGAVSAIALPRLRRVACICAGPSGAGACHITVVPGCDLRPFALFSEIDSITLDTVSWC